MHQELFHLVALCFSILGFLYRKSLAIRGIPDLMAAFLVIECPSRLTQKRLKITEREALGIVHGTGQEFLTFSHNVTIFSYILVCQEDLGDVNSVFSQRRRQG